MPTLHKCYFCGRPGLKNRQAIRGHLAHCPGRQQTDEAEVEDDDYEDQPVAAADYAEAEVDDGEELGLDDYDAVGDDDDDGDEEVDPADLNFVYSHSCGRWWILEPGRSEVTVVCCGDASGEWEEIGWTDAGPGLLPDGASIDIIERE